MLVSNISEEPYLALRHEHSYTQSMYRRISKSLIVESSSSIQPVKVSFIRFAAEEVQVPNLEVGEELAIVVVSAIVGIKQPIQVGIRVYQLWMGIDERSGSRPEGRERAGVVEDIHVETVLHVVVAHEAEDIIVNVAEEMDLPQEGQHRNIWWREAVVRQAQLANTSQNPLAVDAYRRIRYSNGTCVCS